MKIGFLITARLKSTRLPMKLLLDLNGKSIVERVIERCKKVSNISEIILCTSSNKQDRPLVDIAKRNDIYYFLGNEEDVLKRLSDAATFFNLDYIINITGENPLFSIYHANLVVDEAVKNNYDFIHLSGLPMGCAVYGLNPKALKTVCSFKEEIDTEIWGPLINRPEIFDVKEIHVSEAFELPNVRITSDYIEDFQFINEIYSYFDEDSVPSFVSILKIIKDNPEILTINRHRKQASLDSVILERINSFFKTNSSEILRLKDKIYNL